MCVSHRCAAQLSGNGSPHSDQPPLQDVQWRAEVWEEDKLSHRGGRGPQITLVSSQWDCIRVRQLASTMVELSWRVCSLYLHLILLQIVVGGGSLWSPLKIWSKNVALIFVMFYTQQSSFMTEGWQRAPPWIPPALIRPCKLCFSSVPAASTVKIPSKPWQAHFYWLHVLCV